MKRLISLLAIASGFGAAIAPASAGGDRFHDWIQVHEVKLGVVRHDVPDIWSGFSRERGFGLNGEIIFKPSVQILGGTLRPAIGLTVAMEHTLRNDRTASVAFAGGRWTYENARGWFFTAGLGGAVHDGQLTAEDERRKALGSRVLFHIPFELGVRFAGNRSLSIYFEHVSNGGTRTINEGMDSIGMRYGYRF